MTESHEWRRLYEGLLSMKPSGKFDDRDLECDLILVGLVESREVNKACKNCGTPLLDYRYNHITPAGRLFMSCAASAIASADAPVQP